MERTYFQAIFLGSPPGSSFVLRIRVPGSRGQNRHPDPDECGYWFKDIEKIESGSVVIYNENVKLPVGRDDCLVFGLPMTKLARGINPKMAKMIANMYYVGVIQHLIGIDQVALEKAVNRQFKGKKTAVESILEP